LKVSTVWESLISRDIPFLTVCLFMFVAWFSETEWKMNQKAVLCALQTFDHYQKEQVGSVKYIQKTTSQSQSMSLQELADSISESAVTTAQVIYMLL